MQSSPQKNFVLPGAHFAPGEPLRGAVQADNSGDCDKPEARDPSGGIVQGQHGAHASVGSTPRLCSFHSWLMREVILRTRVLLNHDTSLLIPEFILDFLLLCLLLCSLCLSEILALNPCFFLVCYFALVVFCFVPSGIYTVTGSPACRSESSTACRTSTHCEWFSKCSFSKSTAYTLRSTHHETIQKKNIPCCSAEPTNQKTKCRLCVFVDRMMI